MPYTNTFACPQCCTTSCQTLEALFGTGGHCPGGVPNVDVAICLNVQVFHNAVMGTAWVPPSPFGGIFKSDCRLGDINSASVIDSTSGAHPQAPRYPYILDQLSLVGFSPPASGGGVNSRLYVPHFYNAISSTYNFTGNLALQSVGCSPFRYVSGEGQVTDSRDGGVTVHGKFHLEISLGTCPLVPPPAPTPFVSQVTTPCKYLGPQIQDPAKCQCGTANLMACALYGACRRTGTPLAGEPICLTCPSYQSP